MSNTNSSTPINTNTIITTNNVRTRVSKGSSCSSASQACAACKYQRRRCAPDCRMALHFPPNQRKDFHNVHKLFGVSNFLKLLREVQPSQQQAAARSMVVQANIWANDPGGGCYRIIRELEHQIEQCKAEFKAVLRQLTIYRALATRSGDNGFVDVDSLCIYDPMHVQPIDYYGRFQGRDPLYMNLRCHDNIGVRVDIGASSSTMVVNNSNQFFVHELEDIKPLVGINDENQQAITRDKIEMLTMSNKSEDMI